MATSNNESTREAFRKVIKESVLAYEVSEDDLVEKRLNDHFDAIDPLEKRIQKLLFMAWDFLGEAQELEKHFEKFILDYTLRQVREDAQKD